jgi:hypothetical protein
MIAPVHYDAEMRQELAISLAAPDLSQGAFKTSGHTGFFVPANFTFPLGSSARSQSISVMGTDILAITINDVGQLMQRLILQCRLDNQIPDRNCR